MTDENARAAVPPPPPIIAPPQRDRPRSPDERMPPPAAPQQAGQFAAPQQAGQFAAPQFGTPQPQQRYLPAQGRPGWAPPPKPGLIPLAPLTFGTILGAPYRLFRRNPRPTFGMSLLIQGGVTFVTLLVIGLVAWASFSRIDFASSSEETDQLVAGAFGVTLLSALIPVALSIIATGVMQGIISLEVARQTLGEKLTFAGLWARGRGRLWAVGGYSLLLFGAFAVAIALVVGIGIIPFAFGDAGIGAGIVLIILLYLGLLAATLWLSTKLAFVPSAIVLERLGIGAAIARSWRLTRRVFWRVLGTIALVAVILGFATQLVSFPVTFLGGILGGLLAPTGGSDENAVIIILVAVYGITAIVTLVISAISLVVQSATTALLYIDQRMRKEGLDLDLLRFVEARQSGATGIRDPYETADSRPMPTA